MPSPARRRPLGPLLALAVAVAGWTGPAGADQLDAEVGDDERGYFPVQELSYEAIVDADADRGDAVTLRLRVALINTSGNPRDVVHTLALPVGAELVGLQIARDGSWHPGSVTAIANPAGPRDPGTVWARTIDPSSPGGLPAAEVVAFGLESNRTLQVELALRVFPQLRAGRWELELPARGPEQPAMVNERRVLARGLPPGKPFFVDDTPSGSEPAMITSTAEAVTVGWTARHPERGSIVGRLEVTPGPPGFDDGRFRVVLRAGSDTAATPDHVSFVIDRSRSTGARMHRDAAHVILRLLDALPAGTSFDAIGFARTAKPLLAGEATAFDRDDAAARAQLVRVLDANDRAQGTDLGAALELAATRVAAERHSRPMIIVITDGMLPATVDATALRERFDRARGRHRPELTFVIDDDVLARSGLPATHPVAAMAAGLGARISLESLAQLSDDAVLELLAAPRVLGDLALALPPSMQLDRALPLGLVAGNALVASGQYTGKPPRELVVHARVGGKAVRKRLRAHVGTPLPEAFVAATAGELASIASEGFTRPAWLRPGQQRTAREGVAQSGRGRELTGYLDEKIFRNYLTTRVAPRARACYNRSLLREPDQGGRVVLEMEVGKGEVMLARARPDALVHTDERLVACLTEAAWALDVPAAKMDDRVYVVRYPLRLVAPVRPGETGRVERGDDDAMLEVLLAQPAGRVQTR
ncbi:MAG: VWA domain-containing protein [Nannocystaceae bacterium]|nr:VWA domain-containing protein [Nannocystaceae bacterium]